VEVISVRYIFKQKRSNKTVAREITVDHAENLMFLNTNSKATVQFKNIFPLQKKKVQKHIGISCYENH